MTLPQRRVRPQTVRRLLPRTHTPLTGGNGMESTRLSLGTDDVSRDDPFGCRGVGSARNRQPDCRWIASMPTFMKTFKLVIGQTLVGMELSTDGSDTSAPSVVPAQFSSTVLEAQTVETASRGGIDLASTVAIYSRARVTNSMADAFNIEMMAEHRDGERPEVKGSEDVLGYWAKEHEKRAEEILRLLQKSEEHRGPLSAVLGGREVPDMGYSTALLTAFNMDRVGELDARWSVSDTDAPAGSVEISLNGLTGSDLPGRWPTATITAIHRGEPLAASETADMASWGPVLTTQSSIVTISPCGAESSLRPALRAHFLALFASACEMMDRARNMGINLDVTVEPLSDEAFLAFTGLQRLHDLEKERISRPDYHSSPGHRSCCLQSAERPAGR